MHHTPKRSSEAATNQSHRTIKTRIAQNSPEKPLKDQTEPYSPPPETVSDPETRKQPRKQTEKTLGGPREERSYIKNQPPTGNGTLDACVTQVTFRWHRPSGGSYGETHGPPMYTNGTYTQWNNGTTAEIRYAFSTYAPDELGDWGVQTFFQDSKANTRAEVTNVLKIKATSFYVTPEIPFRTVGAIAMMMAALALITLRKKAVLPFKSQHDSSRGRLFLFSFCNERKDCLSFSGSPGEREGSRSRLADFAGSHTRERFSPFIGRQFFQSGKADGRLIANGQFGLRHGWTTIVAPKQKQ